jgi:Family of unknown function (DUF6445)
VRTLRSPAALISATRHMFAIPQIKVSARSAIRLEEVAPGVRVAIVDDFLEAPRSITGNVDKFTGRFVTQPVAHASRGPDLAPQIIEDLYRFLRTRLSKVFGFHRADIRFKAFLSNLALKPEELSPYHRMCHIDPRMSPDHETIAGIVYLFANPELGGTGFYRWTNRELAVEAYRLAASDMGAALAYLEANSETFRSPPEYMTRGTDFAEFLGATPARFNRAVFYSGAVPHSAHITRPELLSHDPAQGRLTLNLFAGVRLRHGTTAANTGV